MKSYAVRTAKTPEDAEAQMNEMAREGWTVKAVTFWETAMAYRLVITFEKEIYSRSLSLLEVSVMQYFPPALENLVEHFAKLPGIGLKSAQRLAFHVLSLPEEKASAFAQAILEAKKVIHCCPYARISPRGRAPAPCAPAPSGTPPSSVWWPTQRT